ncbi:MAG: MFS transporter [Actinoplanes sp.]
MWNVRLYVASYALSLLGDSALWFAAAVWVKALTGNNSAAGMVFFAYTAAKLAAPALSVIVDRTGRRTLLIGTNLATAAIVLALLAVSTPDTIWIVYAVMVLYGISSSIVSAAESALVTTMVPAERLGSVNGLLQTVTQGIRLAGPLIGAGIFATLGPRLVVWLDVATFVIAAGLISLVRVTEAIPAAPEKLTSAAFTAGIRHILTDVRLRQVVAGAAFAVTFFGFLETLMFAVTDGLGREPEFISVLITAQGVGGILGGVTAARVLRATTAGQLTGLGLALFTAGMPLLMVSVLAPVLAGMLLIGAGLPWIVVGTITLLQTSTPPDLQGRAHAALNVALSVPQTLSIALGAGLAAVVDHRLLLAGVAAAFLLSSVYLLTRREQRRDFKLA